MVWQSYSFVLKSMRSIGENKKFESKALSYLAFENLDLQKIGQVNVNSYTSGVPLSMINIITPALSH